MTSLGHSVSSGEQCDKPPPPWAYQQQSVTKLISEQLGRTDTSTWTRHVEDFMTILIHSRVLVE